MIWRRCASRPIRQNFLGGARDHTGSDLSKPRHKFCSMLPELRIGRYVLCGPILRIRGCPSLWRELASFNSVLDTAKPFLVNFEKETRKTPFCFLPGRRRYLKPAAGGSLDLRGDHHVNSYPVHQPPLNQLHPLGPAYDDSPASRAIRRIPE